MTEFAARFQNLRTPEFLIVYATAMLKGAVWYEGPAPDWCPPVDNLVLCPTIFLVTRGEVKVDNKDFPSQYFSRGQGVSATRSKNRYRFTVTCDDTSYVCIVPNSQKIFKREAISLQPGDVLEVPASDHTQYVVLVDGTAEGMDLYEMVKVEAGATRVLEATARALFLRIFE